MEKAFTNKTILPVPFKLACEFYCLFSKTVCFQLIVKKNGAPRGEFKYMFLRIKLINSLILSLSSSPNNIKTIQHLKHKHLNIFVIFYILN